MMEKEREKEREKEIEKYFPAFKLNNKSQNVLFGIFFSFRIFKKRI